MKHYLIDGNNLIGKSKELSSLQKKDKQGVREKLVFKLENYFTAKKVKVSLHFDGFQSTPIRSSIIKIIYSEKRTADELLKTQIEQSTNRRNIIVVSSDRNLLEFSKVCHCDNIPAEQFLEQISRKTLSDEETQRIEEIKSLEEFKRLFGAK